MNFFDWIILGLRSPFWCSSVRDPFWLPTSSESNSFCYCFQLLSGYCQIDIYFQWLHFICFSGQLGKCVCGLGEAAWMPGKMPCIGWWRVSQLFAFWFYATQFSFAYYEWGIIWTASCLGLTYRKTLLIYDRLARGMDLLQIACLVYFKFYWT